jgi:hypothetical protein
MLSRSFALLVSAALTSIMATASPVSSISPVAAYAAEENSSISDII